MTRPKIMLACIGAATALAVGSTSSNSATPASVTVTLTAAGIVEADQQLALTFTAPGRLASVDVQRGEQVVAGQLLARLDPFGAEAAVHGAAGNVSAARAHLAQLEQGLSPAELRQLQITYAQARASVANANQALVDARAAARQDAIHLRTAVTRSRAKLAADQMPLQRDQAMGSRDQATLDADRAALGGITDQLGADRSRLVADEAQLLSDQKRQVDDSTASAPAATLGVDGKAVLDDQAAIASDQSVLADASSTASDVRSSVAVDRTRVDNDLQTTTADQSQIVADHNAETDAKHALGAGMVAERQSVDTATGALSSARIGADAVRTGNAVHLQPARAVLLKAARAAVEVAAASLETASEELRNTRLVAPFPGTIASVDGVVGEMVPAGSGGLITLVNLDHLTVAASFSGAEAALLRAGQTATISIPALAGETRFGRVLAVDPLPDAVSTPATDVASHAASGGSSGGLSPASTYTATVAIRDRPTMLRPGMHVEVAIRATTARLPLPNSTVRPR